MPKRRTAHRAPANAAQGQAMMEYIIVVALIAVAAIGAASMFGKTLRNQVGAVAAALGGDATGAKRANANANQAGKDAAAEAKRNRNLANFTLGTEQE